ncbi:hypothetical protein [Homoserinimonas sp. A520]
MTDTGRASWVHTPTGVIIVNGVIAAIVGAVTGWVLNNASSIPWDRVLWIGLAVAGAAFIALSLLVKRLREMIWRRPVVWVWSLRPVTARRHARELAAAEEARRALAMRADKALDQIRTSLQGVTLQFATQLGDNKQRVDLVVKAVEDLDKHLKAINDRSAALTIDQKSNAPATPAAEKPSQSEVLPASPLPRWRLIHPDRRDDAQAADGQFLLQNLIDGSIAKNVRIENTGEGYFEFEDAAFWSDMSGKKSNTFGGTIAKTEPSGSVQLRVSYLDYLERERDVLFLVNRDGSVRQRTDEERTLYI